MRWGWRTVPTGPIICMPGASRHPSQGPDLIGLGAVHMPNKKPPVPAPRNRAPGCTVRLGPAGARLSIRGPCCRSPASSAWQRWSQEGPPTPRRPAKTPGDTRSQGGESRPGPPPVCALRTSDPWGPACTLARGWSASPEMWGVSEPSADAAGGEVSRALASLGGASGNGLPSSGELA